MNSSFNFPLNEKSFEINPNESSFQTYHSALNQSFHGSDVQTMNSETESNENDLMSMNQNFTSILNGPQHKVHIFHHFEFLKTLILEFFFYRNVQSSIGNNNK